MVTKLDLKNDLSFYNELKSYAFRAYKKKQIEKSLKYIYYAASYAWLVHIGIWCDDDLERLLSAIGNYCKSKKQSIYKTERKDKKIGFIASILRDVGGHNILLKHWISILSDSFKDQELYITKIDRNPLNYPFLKKSLKEKSVNIYELPEKLSFLDKIFRLIALIEKNAPDTLLTFTHPNDVTLIPALTALSSKPFTIFFNHADHVFWLGKNISDCVIEQRIDGAKFSKKFRRITVNQFIVPLTTEIKPQKISKNKYDVPETSTLSISVGGIMKVESPFKYNYYKTIELILKKFPNHYHMFVTDYPPQTTPKELANTPEDVKKRFIINGPFPNLEPIYGVGDFIIDTFPIGGGMVIVDAMACGLPIVAFRNEEFPILSDGGGELPENYPYITSNYNQFIGHISQLIENQKLRIKAGEQLFNYYNQNLSPNAIRKLLISIINGDTTNKLTIGTDEEEFNYDIKLGQKTFLIDRKNLLILDLKHSGFSIKQRLKIFFGSLRRNEFKSIKELFLFGLIAIFRNFVSNLYYIMNPQKIYQSVPS